MNRRVQEDVTRLLHAHEANILSSREPEEKSGAPNWEDLALRARAGDTGLSIGGIIVWKETVIEERSIFRLLRHPEWMGLNRIMPASTCSRPNFRVHVPVAGTEQCGRPPSHQDQTGRKAATEKLHQYTSTKGEPEGPTDEAPP